MRSTEETTPKIAPPDKVQDLNWSSDKARDFALEIVDLWSRYLDELPALPVARAHNQSAVQASVALPIPAEPMSAAEIMDHLETLVFDNATNSGHPCFTAYVTSSGIAPGAIGDFLASGINQNLRGWLLAPGATEIELHLTRWMAQRCGLPATAGGLMLSGGAMANFTALKVARDAASAWKTREAGIQGQPQLTLYASSQAHAVIERSADMLGLGTSAVRVIGLDDSYRMRTDLLEAAIQDDLTHGRKPFAVVATAGTTATGAIDPLPEIAELCKQYKLWLHVDGAYGVGAVLADDLRPSLAGIELADSIAWDPHKWLYMPQSAGCVLFRDMQQAADGFSIHPSYIYQDKVTTGRGMDMHAFGPQFGRSFQAMKIWLSFLACGTDAFARRISHDAALARWFGERVKGSDDFELMTPVSLSICCFRYVPHDLPANCLNDDYLNELNSRLLTEIQMDGRVFCSNAVLGGRFSLRICIVNVRTEADDLDKILAVAAELGAKLDREMRAR